MSEEKKILVTKTNSSLDKYIVEKDTRFDVVNSEQIIKRLEQENKELKTYIQKMDKPEIKTIDSEIALKNIELQEENEELKQENKRLNEEMWDLYSSTVLNLCCCSDINEYRMLKMNMRKDVVLYNKFSKYRQTLKEIRNEIGDLKDINRLINLQKILDKINEVLK